MDVTERSSRDSPSPRRPLTWPGTALPRGLPRARPGAGEPTAPAAATPAGHITRTGRTGQPAAPAVPGPESRRTRPAEQHRLSPGTWDGERQMPASGRLVGGIMPAAGDHAALRASMMPDHAGDPGMVPSGLEPHDHLPVSQGSARPGSGQRTAETADRRIARRPWVAGAARR
jgi:hypothetical protein